MKPGSLIRTFGVCCALGLFSGSQSAHAQSLVDSTTAPIVLAPIVVTPAAPVVNEQLRNSRVRDARDVSEAQIEQLFKSRNVAYPASDIFIRVFKWERTLELWARSTETEEFQLVKSYPICAMAGMLGPKVQQGDAQVPEGFYYIDRFNPSSSFHLSLGINYPNERDRAANKAGHNLGGQIFIHGGCKSEGCLAMTDEGIKELYWIALTTHANGQERIPVHIFPMRFSDKHVKGVGAVKESDPELAAFWRSLKPGFEFFQVTRRLPEVGLDADGQYRIDANSEMLARALTIAR